MFISSGEMSSIYVEFLLTESLMQIVRWLVLHPKEVTIRQESALYCPDALAEKLVILNLTHVFLRRSGMRYVSPAWWKDATGKLNSLDS